LVFWRAADGESARRAAYPYTPRRWNSGAGSNSLRLRLGPVGVADQALVELAGRVTRQLLHEVDLAGQLHRREVGATEGGQFGAQARARIGPVERLNHRHDLLAHLLVRSAHDGGVGDPGMSDQQVLDLLRIDVHPARD